MKFHNFVCNEMYVHFSSRWDENGYSSDGDSAMHFLGGYIYGLKINAHDYWFEPKENTTMAGCGGCRLDFKYSNNLTDAGLRDTYRNLKTAIAFLTNKINQGRAL